MTLPSLSSAALSVMDAFQIEVLVPLQPYLEEVSFSEGDVIFEIGSAPEAFYVIDEGEVRLEVPSPEPDTDTTLEFSGFGSFIGEVAFLAGTEHWFTAIAHTGVVAHKVSTQGLRRLYHDNPEDGLKVARALARDTATKLRRTSERMADYLDADAPDPEVEDMVARANAAQQELESWSEERVDALLEDIANAVSARAEELADLEIAETTIGNRDDKVIKNQLGSLGVYSSLAGQPGYGVLSSDDERKVTEIASPVGVVFGIIPLTNPVPTIVNKTLISLKSRNALIFSVHRRAQDCGNVTGELVQGVLERHGAPVDLVQWVRGRTSRRRTAKFMRHEGIGLILATGGPGMVKAAYSSGKPAIGVGAGNAPAWVAADADADAVAQAVIDSKGFDNGLICGSEQHLVVDSSIRESLVDALERHGAAVLDEEQTGRFMEAVFDPQTNDLLLQFVGRDASLIAQAAGVERPDVRLVVFQADSSDPHGAAAHERLAPVVSLFTVDGDDQAVWLCKQLLAHDGAGHTAIVHTADRQRIERFALAMPTSRILANVPAAHGCAGVATGLLPTWTLGCGTWGGNSTTDNVGHHNLRNVKRLAEPVGG